MDLNKIYVGKCEIVLQQFPDNTFDSCVTDPPYGYKFMGKKWDYQVPTVDQWREILRVLKPGAHILVACGTRTQHRMAVNIEDAGFEIRDVITWHYGSGFPKSMDISKAIDKAAGAEREVVGTRSGKGGDNLNKLSREGGNDSDDGKSLGAYGKGAKQINVQIPVTKPATDSAKEWDGWGTALKPATEFWTLARKPLSENTVADNVMKWETGGINIKECSIETTEIISNHSRGADAAVSKGKYGDSAAQETFQTDRQIAGRFPANVILDEFMGAELDRQTGNLKGGGSVTGNEPSNPAKNTYGEYNRTSFTSHNDAGGASRFFYCAKADGSERNKGVDPIRFRKLAEHHMGDTCATCGGRIFQSDRPSACKCDAPDRQPKLFEGNHHPTVKPIDLMRYLVKLVTPKKGIVLDPFCGSGTTLIGAKLELRNYIGIDMDPEYCDISEARVAAWNPERYLPQELF